MLQTQVLLVAGVAWAKPDRRTRRRRTLELISMLFAAMLPA
jgi:hypothetical protein